MRALRHQVRGRPPRRRRRSPQCRPHSRCRRGSRAPGRRRGSADRRDGDRVAPDQSADALGPPSLWAERVIRSAPRRLDIAGILPAAWTASTCSSRRPHARSRRPRRPAGSRRSRCWRASRRRAAGPCPSASAASRRSRAARSMRPSGVDRNVRPSLPTGNRPPARTDGCSIAEMNSRSRGALSPPISIAGVSASALASVPPDVKVTSRGARRQAGHLLAGFLDGAAGRAALRMDRRRVAGEIGAPPAKRRAPAAAAARSHSNRDRPFDPSVSFSPHDARRLAFRPWIVLRTNLRPLGPARFLGRRACPSKFRMVLNSYARLPMPSSAP